MLFLWHLSQKENKQYDTYGSMVVAAHSEEEAKTIHPDEDNPRCNKIKYDSITKSWMKEELFRKFDENTCKYIEKIIYTKFTKSWASTPENVTAKCLGIAFDTIKPRQIICSSFRAG